MQVLAAAAAVENTDALAAALLASTAPKAPKRLSASTKPSETQALASSASTNSVAPSQILTEGRGPASLATKRSAAPVAVAATAKKSKLSVQARLLKKMGVSTRR